MFDPDDLPTDDRAPVPPRCRATADALQRALDGDAPFAALDADPHPALCADCGGRVRAARALLAALGSSDPAPAPNGFADRVLAAVREDGRADARRAERRNLFVRAGRWAALAAAVLVAVFVIPPVWERNRKRPNETFADVAPSLTPPRPDAAPKPRPQGPERPQVKVSTELAKAVPTFRAPPKPLVDSVAVAPRLLGALTGPLAQSVAPDAAPGGRDMLEPARRSLAELPVAARAGLEPVTGTAQKAFAKLIRDVSAVTPKPNS